MRIHFPVHAPHHPADLPHEIWAPATSLVLIAVLGIAAFATRQPLLFPSLGPSIYLQTASPKRPAAHFYNTLVGHLIGLAAGLIAVVALGAAQTPSAITGGDISPLRIGAAALAVGLTVLGGVVLHAVHPPSAGTALLVALGGFQPTLHDSLVIIASVFIVAIVGEALRRLRLNHLLARHS